MARWLHSGTRRDVCYVLCGADGLRRGEVKSRLEARYGERLDPQSFHGTLETLLDTGHVESSVDGIHDVYALTDAGERALREQQEWVREQVDDDEGGKVAEGEDGNGKRDDDVRDEDQRDDAR